MHAMQQAAMNFSGLLFGDYWWYQSKVFFNFVYSVFSGCIYTLINVL